MRIVTNTALLVIAAAVFALTSIAGAEGKKDEEKAKAKITAPEENGEVDKSDEIEGELMTDGWPVVLVKPLAGESEWWIQSLVSEVKDGKFSTQCQFGDDKTEPGTKFRVIVIVAKNKKEAETYKRGEKRTSLPAGLPRSKQVTVKRKKD